MKPSNVSRRKFFKKEVFFSLLLILTTLASVSPVICHANAGEILRKNKNAVVIVETFDKDGNLIDHASGFNVSSDGAIVTNYHVLGNAASIRVRTEDKVFAVRGFLFLDKESDIAILKIDAEHLPNVTIQHDTGSGEGQKIFIIGNPLGQGNMTFEGTLNRIRELRDNKQILLITTPVTKTFSGGPVFNEHGEVIGIATFLIGEVQPFYFAMSLQHIKGQFSADKVIPLRDADVTDYKRSSEYWINLGIAYESLNLYPEASRAFQKAVTINPDNAESHYRLGASFEFMNIHSFAIVAYRNAIRLKDAYQEAYYGLGISYLRADMEREAIEAFEQIIRINPVHFMAYYSLAIAYSKLHMNQEAIEYCKEALTIKPENAEAHYILGTLYSSHDTAAALKEFEILQNLNPRYANELSNFLAMKGINPAIDAEVTARKPEKSMGNNAPGKIISSATALPVSPKKAPHLNVAKKKPVSPSRSTTPSNVVSAKELSGDFGEEAVSSKMPGEPVTRSEPIREQGEEALSNKAFYSVQVGVFENKKNAQALFNRLRKKGYAAFIKTEYRIEENTRHRVLVGTFSEKDTALKTAGTIFKREKMKSILYIQ